jgi:uncharacterized protein YbaR (Trm112 family)
VEERRSAPPTEEPELPFPLERLRGRIVFCADCGNPLAVFRRRRFYALRATVEGTPQGGVLVCRSCGKRYPIRTLFATERRARRQ